MICGNTVESWLSNSCWLMPVRCESSASTFWPSAEPSCPGGTGSFGPCPTQELTCGDTPPALSLPIRSVRPPRMLPAGAFVGTGCPGGGIGMDGVDAGEDAGEELPPNILPRISAPTATAIGVVRLPPGTAFFIASSNEAIVVSSTSVQIAEHVPRPQPSAAIRRNHDQDYRLAFCSSIPHIRAPSSGAWEAWTWASSAGSFWV